MAEVTEFTIPATIRVGRRPDGSNKAFEFNLIGFSTVMLNDLIIDAVVSLAKREGTTPRELLRKALDSAPEGSL